MPQFIVPIIVSICVSIVSGIISYLMRPSTPDSTAEKQNALVQVSSYGQNIPLVYGKMRIPGNIIWAPAITTTKHTEQSEGGKGGGGGSITYYTYSDTFAVMIAANSVEVKKVWANDEMIRNVSGDGWRTGDATKSYSANGNFAFYDVCPYFFIQDKGITWVASAYKKLWSYVGSYVKQPSEIGISTGGNASNTLKNTIKHWLPNAHKNRYVKIYAGTGVGQTKRITSNSSSQLVIDGTWATIPDNTSKYWIFKYSHKEENPDPENPINQSPWYLFPGQYSVNPDAAYAGAGGTYVCHNLSWDEQPVTITIKWSQRFWYVDSKHHLLWYNGSWTQERSPYVYNLSNGVSADVPAYRGRAYGVFVDMQLKDYGNALPNCMWEVQNNLGVKNGLDVQVKYIVEDLCLRAGLTADQFDCSGLTGTIRGIAISGETARSSLEKLGLCCGFETVESGNKIKFVQCGQNPCATILESELIVPEDIEKQGDYISMERKYEHELPQRVTLQFTNYNDDERPCVVSSMRMNTTSKQAISLNMPVNMTFEQARAVTRMALKTAWITRDTYKFKLSRKYWYLEPLDIITMVRNDGTSLNLKIMKMSDGRSGYIETEAVEEQIGEYL